MSNSGVDTVLQTSSILVDDFCFGIGKPPTLERFPKVLKSQSMGFCYQGPPFCAVVASELFIRMPVKSCKLRRRVHVRKREKHVDAERRSSDEIMARVSILDANSCTQLEHFVPRVVFQFNWSTRIDVLRTRRITAVPGSRQITWQMLSLVPIR
jgi:hypothetical protein